MDNEAEVKLATIKRSLSKLYSTLPHSFREGAMYGRFATRNDNSKLMSTLLKSDDYFELIKHACNLEKKVYKRISSLIQELDVKKPINQQPKKLEKLNRYFDFLKNSTLLLASECPYFLAQESSATYRDIKLIQDSILLRKFPIDEKTKQGKSPADLDATSNNEDILLSHCKNFMLLSMVKVNSTTSGQAMIRRLAELATEFKEEKGEDLLHIQIQYYIHPDSLKAYPNGDGVYCKLTVETSESSLPMEKLVYLDVISGQSASTTFTVPVVFKPSPELSEIENYEQYFNNLGVHLKDYEALDRALTNFSVGSISFDRDGIPFFTPAHIEFMHESLHAIDNAEGKNYGKINQGDAVWDNAAEYLAIEGGKLTEHGFNKAFTENALNQESGLPARYGHAGFAVNEFFDSSNKSLQELLPRDSRLLKSSTLERLSAFLSSSSSSSSSSHGKGKEPSGP